MPVVLGKGSEVGRYTIQGELGRGAIGTVYLSWDPLIERPVALKIVDLSRTAEGEARTHFYNRFLNEARAAGKLVHHGIVTVYDVGTDTTRAIAYIAMEYVAGPVLGRMMQARRLTIEEGVRIAMQLLEALQYAHEKGVIHRDIKPGNIILTPNGVPKIADFGVAKVVDTQLTTEGTVLGSPNYMSPEQAQARLVDHRSDLFSLGLVTYEMLSGVKAFQGSSIPETLYRVVHTDPAPIREVAPDVPKTLADLVERSIKKNPEERFPDAAAMLAALHDVSTVTIPNLPTGVVPPIEILPVPAGLLDIASAATLRSDEEAPRSPRRRRGRRAAWIAAAAAVAVLALAVLAVVLIPGRAGPGGVTGGGGTSGPDGPTPAGGALPPRPPMATATRTPGAAGRKTPKAVPPATTAAAVAVTPAAAAVTPANASGNPAAPVAENSTPIRIQVTHYHKFGGCTGTLSLYRDHAELQSPEHKGGLTFKGKDIKKIELSKDQKLFTFSFQHASYARLGGAKQQAFRSATALPADVISLLKGLPGRSP